ncbi:MAG: hypothetical protein KA474_09560 [Acinetobacter sp.]|nr:hypothetical protein [Acinetobacter sp.]
MAYVCEVLETATQTCVHWAVYSPVLPELTNEARNELLKWAIGIFLSVFAFRMTLRVIK